MTARLARFCLIVGLAAGACGAASAQIITDFEANGSPAVALGANAMFRAPNFSGSTSAFLETTPNLSAASNEQAFSGSQSLKVSWQFKAAQTNPWVRLTTSAAPILPNPTLDFTQALKFEIYVPSTTPDFYVTLGVRETGTTAAVGADGGTSGTIEFLGATTKNGSAPVGRRISAKDQWVDVVFNIPSEPVLGFTGNGKLDGTKGTLENLAFTPVDSTAVGPYTFYLDTFQQVAPVPAPGAFAVFCAGGIPLAFVLSRRRTR